ncbi:MAG: type II toxin-antitoxin system prevent-host-death family antitoxin [Magnetococcales bacterium]|nr:type II toxin-antitoxin system prevent-host-death family antitoxin [Magnetococcales bacterium]MBF0149021.1 type II toxin-antitoxin system prevent-host-death family antitoxin [Magnetococcales bacterium]MBF0346182.1 type II toxin-antitoxin system prevent-host-death family antitoxin [Magnetococcales bacterium]MBF0630325.1 type II toxin-antitoxin system prevent-host-death family antitoxin [Magnetococcales bacterium]
MDTVGAFEANTHLSALLMSVAQGEKITLTKHGVPVAVMCSPGLHPKRDRYEMVQALREFRANHLLGNRSLRLLIEEGRDEDCLL